MTIQITKQGQGKPLVLFHGWGFDGQIWNFLLPHLTMEFTVYCVDLPGFGHTAAMSWPNFKKQLLSHLPSRFALLGWSLGGLYATRLALEACERITHLINVTSSPYFLAKDSWPGVSQTVFEGFYHRLLSDPVTVLQQFIQLQSKGLITIPYQGNIPSPQSLQEGLAILGQWDFRLPLSNFSKPACYIFGQLDAITPVKIVAAMQEKYPLFQYELIKKAAHMPFLSHKEQFIAILRAFLL